MGTAPRSIYLGVKLKRNIGNPSRTTGPPSPFSQAKRPWIFVKFTSEDIRKPSNSVKQGGCFFTCVGSSTCVCLHVWWCVCIMWRPEVDVGNKRSIALPSCSLRQDLSETLGSRTGLVFLAAWFGDPLLSPLGIESQAAAINNWPFYSFWGIWTLVLMLAW